MDNLSEAQYANYLAHYGVLGMKWGVRNAESRVRIARDKKSSAKREFKNTRTKLNEGLANRTHAKARSGETRAQRKELSKKLNEQHKSRLDKAKATRDKKIVDAKAERRAAQGLSKKILENRIANGEATIAKSLTSMNGVTMADLVKNKGNLGKAVESRNAKNRESYERLLKGRGSVRDVISFNLSLTVKDLLGASRSK